MTDGSVAGFKFFQFEGVTRIQIITRRTGNGKVEVRTTLEGERVGIIEITSMEEWHISVMEDPVMLEGIQALYFTYMGKDI